MQLMFSGDAAYVAANHRTYFPLLLLAGMLLAVLMIYAILFRQLKPYHSVQQKHPHSDADSEDVEMIITDRNCDQEFSTTSEVTLL